MRSKNKENNYETEISRHRRCGRRSVNVLSMRQLQKSRALGGRNLRTRSQALVNDELLIDFNADSYWHFIQYNIDWERVCGCIITHSHPDHLYPAEVEIAKPSLSNQHRRIDFYSAKSGYDMLMTEVPGTKGQASATLIRAENPSLSTGSGSTL